MGYNVVLNTHSSHLIFFQDYNAKLSDFGLAKDGPEGDDTHVSTRVMGTHGYAAPEYVMTGNLTTLNFQLIQFPYNNSNNTKR